MKMNLFFSSTLVAVLGLVRCLDLKCKLDFAGDTNCKIVGPVTVKIGEKLNIVSKGNLNSINTITFYPYANQRSQISTVPSEIFEQLPNLQTLKLYAAVEVLNKGDFGKAGKLKNLIIGNQLKIIPTGVLNSVESLERLILSDNQISEIEDNAFTGLNALSRIDLQDNNLTIIKQNTFNGLERLELLYLSSNQIESIEENALNLPNLKELWVNRNKLTSLSDNLFVATPLLKYFTANRNQINQIGTSLYGLKNLEDLSLDHNKLTDVDLMAFSQAPVLVTLTLDDNGLTSEIISRIDVKEQSKSVLLFLSLIDNELINNEDWKKLALLFPQLKHIDVQNNKYSKIDFGDKTLRQQFPKLETLYTSSGEWNCDWLKSFVESSKKDGIDIRRTIGSSNTNGKEVNDIGCV